MKKSKKHLSLVTESTVIPQPGEQSYEMITINLQHSLSFMMPSALIGRDDVAIFCEYWPSGNNIKLNCFAQFGQCPLRFYLGNDLIIEGVGIKEKEKWLARSICTTDLFIHRVRAYSENLKYFTDFFDNLPNLR